MLERTSTAERFARGFAAALVAVATLVLAANAGPARATAEGRQADTCVTNPAHAAGATLSC